MKGSGTKELEQLKFLRVKIREVTSKSAAITDKKGKQYVRHIIYQVRAFACKGYPCSFLYR